MHQAPATGRPVGSRTRPSMLTPLSTVSRRIVASPTSRRSGLCRTNPTVMRGQGNLGVHWHAIDDESAIRAGPGREAMVTRARSRLVQIPGCLDLGSGDRPGVIVHHEPKQLARPHQLQSFHLEVLDILGNPLLARAAVSRHRVTWGDRPGSHHGDLGWDIALVAAVGIGGHRRRLGDRDADPRRFNRLPGPFLANESPHPDRPL